jgi:hypothetical protein
MMRYIFFTLLGFFGPALIMLFLRLLWYRIRHQWLTRKQEPETIDVTPKKPSGYPSKRFIAMWIAISLACTGFLLWQLDNTPAPDHTYIPAHIDAEGNFIPAQTIEDTKQK